MTNPTDPPICETHGCAMVWIDNEMEWAPGDFPPAGGVWYCELCALDDEADFDPEHSDFEDSENE